MKEFFKKIGQGFLGIIALPFVLVLIALGLVVGAFIFFGYLFVLIFRFFRGDNLFPMSEREELAAQILRERAEKSQNPITPEGPAQTIIHPAPQIFILQTGVDGKGQPVFSPVANPTLVSPTSSITQQAIIEQPVEENAVFDSLIEGDSND